MARKLRRLSNDIEGEHVQEGERLGRRKVVHPLARPGLNVPTKPIPRYDRWKTVTWRSSVVVVVVVSALST